MGKKIDPLWYDRNGFAVEFWDLTRLYYTESALSAYFGGHESYRFAFPRERQFVSRQEVRSALKNLRGDCFLCLVDFGQQNDYWLRRLLKLFQIPYYVGPRRTSVPDSHFRNPDIIFLWALRSVPYTIFRCANPGRILRKSLDWLYRNTSVYQKPEFVVGSGTLGRKQWLEATQSGIFVSVPSVDLTWEPLPRLLSERYFVYVDDAVAYSPDIRMTNGSGSTCKDLSSYARKLRKLFDAVERTNGCRVVIAASGKFRYRGSDMFGGREIFYEKTNQLIQHGEAILGHSSSALWQVVISYKPVVILWDDTFITAKNRAIFRMAEFFGVTPLSLARFTEECGIYDWNVNRERFRSIETGLFREHGVSGDVRTRIAEEIERASKFGYLDH